MLILTFNLGSTSSKVAVFENEEEKFSKTVRHDAEILAKSKLPADQYEMRKENIYDAIKEAGYNLSDFDAVCSRAGLVKSVASGTYVIDEEVIKDAKHIEYGGRQPHGLGLMIAKAINEEYGIPAYFCDPVSTEELAPVAKITGFAPLTRISRFHALNHKAIARKCAAAIGKPYEELNLIGVHMGGGVSVAAHKNGQCVEITDCSEDGCFSMDRPGDLPVLQLVTYVDQQMKAGKTANDIKFELKRQAGVFSYLGTSDMMEVENRMNAGDEEAKLIFEAFAYQHAKSVGSCAAALNFKVDGIFLTGGIAYSKTMVDLLKGYFGNLAPIYEFPGEEEMKSLAMGALRVLNGETEAKEYGTAACEE